MSSPVLAKSPLGSTVLRLRRDFKPIGSSIARLCPTMTSNLICLTCEDANEKCLLLLAIKDTSK
jgi:hypothetical protein